MCVSDTIPFHAEFDILTRHEQMVVFLPQHDLVVQVFNIALPVRVVCEDRSGDRIQNIRSKFVDTLMTLNKKKTTSTKWQVVKRINV